MARFGQNNVDAEKAVMAVVVQGAERCGVIKITLVQESQGRRWPRRGPVRCYQTE